MKPRYLIITFTVFIFIVGVLYIFSTQKSSIKTVLPTDTFTQVASSTKVVTIVAFGDSLTAGYGVQLNESYPSQLEKELTTQGKNVRVINMGVSGETTTAGLDRVAFVLAQKPDLILLGLGANDMLRSSSPSIAKKNLKSILEQFKLAGTPVILLGMKSVSSNGELYTEEFDSIYPTLAKEYNVPLVPFFLEGVALDPTLNTSDGIHPNKKGYSIIIKNNVLPVLLKTMSTIGL